MHWFDELSENFPVINACDQVIKKKNIPYNSAFILLLVSVASSDIDRNLQLPVIFKRLLTWYILNKTSAVELMEVCPCRVSD